MIAFAVDLGGSHVACAVVEDRKILARSQISFGLDGKDVHCFHLLTAIAAQLKRLSIQPGIRSSKVEGVAFGFPGLVDSRMGRVVATNEKFNDAREIDFADWALRELNLPLRLDNDARLALMGEHYAGAARGHQDAAIITLGTGIGAAAMMDGQPLRGSRNRAGCLGGHLPVVLHGRECTCGNVGCAEAEASTRALSAIAREMPGYSSSLLHARRDLDFGFVFECAEAGDAVAAAVVERCCAVWSALAVAMLHAYSPEVLLIGGGVMMHGGVHGERILARIREHVGRYAWDMDGSTVQPAALGADAALLGSVPRLIEG